MISTTSSATSLGGCGFKSDRERVRYVSLTNVAEQSDTTMPTLATPPACPMQRATCADAPMPLAAWWAKSESRDVFPFDFRALQTASRSEHTTTRIQHCSRGEDEEDRSKQN